MPAAAADMRSAHAYYAERNPAAAERVIGAILRAAYGLAQYPLLGRYGDVPGTRERLVRRYRYRIVYQLVDDTVEVLRVLHPSQQWP